MGVVPTLWRKIWAVLALVVALNFAYQAGPGHSDYLDYRTGGADAVSVTDHHLGDGDAGHSGHLGGAHCAGHCGGHAADQLQATESSIAVTREATTYDVAPVRVLHDDHPEPLTRPPSA